MQFNLPEWLPNRNTSVSINSSGNSGTSRATGVAGLQLSGGKVPGINDVEMPDWLQDDDDGDGNIQELLKTYAGIGAAFNPKDQVAARNNAASYNLSAGTQAANNAATEYTNRAAVTGGSTLGAGVVRAQALMPVLQQNAALKTEGADIAAKSHQTAISLAAQVASTIGQLRQSYLSTLTGFASDQQKLGLDASQFDADLNYRQRGLDLETERLSITAKQQADSERRLAATALLDAPGPTGKWQTNNAGQVTEGQADYDAYQKWAGQCRGATGTLANIAG